VKKAVNTKAALKKNGTDLNEYSLKKWIIAGIANA
jgi:hypothetical protein